MTDLATVLRRLGVGVEHTVDDLKYALKERFGWRDPVTVQAYRSHGTRDRVHLFARVLEEGSARALDPSASTWDNLVQMYHVLESDEVPRAELRVSVGDETVEVTADREGYASATIDGTFAPGCHEVTWEVRAPLVDGQARTRFFGEVYIPRPEADFVVVSDVDDTVMHTEATSLLRIAVNTLLHNARDRVAFPGVAAFYRALAAGVGDPSAVDPTVPHEMQNPFFYLTSSMWNVYDLIRLFFQVNRVPPGPILMRDLGLSRHHWLKSSHEEHKLSRLRHLVEVYPMLPFVLIGDTGQRDAEIYAQICREHPEQIRAVYLRDVSPAARDAEVAALIEEMRALGIPALAAETSRAHAEHAAELGLIDRARLDEIAAEVVRDEA